jgi:hypothetical protein
MNNQDIQSERHQFVSFAILVVLLSVQPKDTTSFTQRKFSSLKQMLFISKMNVNQLQSMPLAHQKEK